ncbi:MAG TPA: ATP-binding protein [Candidatus Methylomirabilis sp.]|nr:ATP-binding protein [Candidatus Methylomirabilis sp.]
MQLSLVPLLLGCTACFNLLIGTYVYRQAPTARPNSSFAFVAVTVSLWTTAIDITHYGHSGQTWALRLAFASCILAPLGILAFIESLPADSVRTRARTWFFTPLALALCGLSFSPWLVVEARVEAGITKPVYGPLHAVFACYVALWFCYSVYLLVTKYRAATGLLRLQIRYLVFAFAVPSALIILTNLVVPLFLGTSIPGRYGPFFSLVMLALIGHAIIRHRLMDMQIVIKKSAVYLAAFFAAGVILIALLIGSNLLFHEERYTPVREVVLALAVAVFFSPLKAQIQRAFDRYLYREPYDYQRTIREASRALGDTIELPRLLSYLGSLVVRTMKCEGVAIYLRDDEAGHFELSGCEVHGMADRFPSSLALSSAVITRVAQSRETLFLDEIGEGPMAPDGRELRGEFRRLGADVIVPLIEQEHLVGLVCIGPKRSGDPYYSDDADLLTTLANQSAVAIRKAQTHQRVVQMNEELQKILSTIESGVIAVGSRGKIALFNRAAELLTGMPAQSAFARKVEDLPPPLARLILGTVQGGQPRSQEEFALPDAAGQLVPLVCSTSPLLDLRGKTVGAVAVLADLSRLKELEQEKRRAERLESLEAIASGMVHEIRNPLVAIKTFTQLLPIRFGDEEFRDTFSRVADREIRRIDDLLTRFRTLSSASSQPMELVTISSPLDDTFETLRPRLEERRIQLRRVADGDPRLILGNTFQLEQLFLNLCLNAIEAMEPGGELTVRVADLCEAGGTTLLVEISDTGCGIPEDLLATIFNPFVTTKPHGTGLGLAICRSITDAHHAILSVRNNVGRLGTTFTIEFPVPVGRGPNPGAGTRPVVPFDEAPAGDSPHPTT